MSSATDFATGQELDSAAVSDADETHIYELSAAEALTGLDKSVGFRLYVWSDSGQGMFKLGGRYKNFSDSRKGESDILLIGRVESRKGYKTYHLGNSLMDTVVNLLEPVARSGRYDHKLYRCTVPGAPTEFLWKKKQEFDDIGADAQPLAFVSIR